MKVGLFSRTCDRRQQRWRRRGDVELDGEERLLLTSGKCRNRDRDGDGDASWTETN